MKHHNLKRSVTGKRTHGFTLIELMIVVVVIAIVVSVAYPSYSESVRKSRRSDAKSALLEAANRQELFFSNFNTYTTVVVPAASPCAGTACGLNFGSTSSPEGYYTISVSAANNTSFLLTASRMAGTSQEEDKCGNFRLTNTGAQTITSESGGMTAAKCW